MLQYDKILKHNYNIDDHKAGDPQWAYTTPTSHRVASETCGDSRNRRNCVGAANKENNHENSQRTDQTSMWYRQTKWSHWIISPIRISNGDQSETV